MPRRPVFYYFFYSLLLQLYCITANRICQYLFSKLDTHKAQADFSAKPKKHGCGRAFLVTKDYLSAGTGTPRTGCTPKRSPISSASASAP